MSDQPDDPIEEGHDAPTNAPELSGNADEALTAEAEQGGDAAAIEGADQTDADAEGEADAEASATADAAGGKPEFGDPETDEAARSQLKRVLEALIFVSDRAVQPAQLARTVKVRVAVVRPVLKELMAEYEDRGLQLIEVSGGYQFRSSAECSPWVRDWVAQKPVRLSRAQLETLALVAYRQPITRPEIDDVRGVDTGSAVRVLLDRGLLKILGRKDEAGRPLLYGTTPHFLEFFGMKSLRDLPTLREFTELSDENRALFKHKTGETVEDAEAELAAAEERARRDGEEDDGEQPELDEDALAAAAEEARDEDAQDSSAELEDSSDHDEGDDDDSHEADGEQPEEPDEEPDDEDDDEDDEEPDDEDDVDEGDDDPRSEDEATAPTDA